MIIYIDENLPPQLAEGLNKLLFLKQWVGTNKNKAGKMFEGKVYNEMPVITESL